MGVSQRMLRVSRVAGFIFIFMGVMAQSVSADTQHLRENCSLRLRLMTRLFKQPVERLAFRAKPWKFNEKQEAYFSEIFEQDDIDDVTTFSQLMSALYDAQVSNGSRVARFFLRGPRSDPYGHHSLYSKTAGKIIAKFVGPHYNPLVNRVASPLSKRKNSPSDNILLDMLAIHEGTHALDRNLRPVFTGFGALAMIWDFKNSLIKTPLTPAIQYRMETEAVGAQWELVHRLPPAVRQRLVSQLQNDVSHYPLAHLKKLETQLEELKAKKHQYQIEYLQTAKELFFTSQSEEVNHLQNNARISAELHSIFDKLDRLSSEAQTPETAYWFVSAYLQPTLSDRLSVLHHQITQLHKDQQDYTLDYLQIAKRAQSWSRFKINEEVMWSSLYNSTLHSLLRADLSKAEFLRAQLPLHDYDPETIIKEHYRYRFKDACFMSLGILFICINSATHYRQSAIASMENYRVIYSPTSFDIRSLQHAQAKLIEPLSSWLVPLVSDDHFVSEWIDTGLQATQEANRKTASLPSY